MHKKIKSPSENSLSHCHFRDFALPKPSSTPLNSQKWSQWQVPVNQFQGWNFLFIPDQPIYDISYHLQANNCQLLDMHKNLEEKDGQRQLFYYVSLIRACNKVLYQLVYIGKKFAFLKKNLGIQ